MLLKGTSERIKGIYVPYTHVLEGQFLTSSVSQFHALPLTFNLVLCFVIGPNIHQTIRRSLDWLLRLFWCMSVCVFIQRNINNEPFWTRLYRGGDKILVGLKIDTKTCLTVLDIYQILMKVWRSSISALLRALSLSRSRDWRVDTIQVKEEDNSKSCTLLLEWLPTCEPRYRD